jgi:hypothetical protein
MMMNKQMVKNYVVVKSFNTLRELGKVKGRTQFSRFYCGRNTDYFSMILRSKGRLVSLGALHRLSKRLGCEIENETNGQARKKLSACVDTLQAEITSRLDRQASLYKTREKL